jgi:glutathionylspermidine synthase
LRRLPDDALLDMGLSPAMVRWIRSAAPGPAATVIGRFDFVRTRHGFKMLEFNADVPGLLVETFSVNRAVCNEHGKLDPNEGAENFLARALLDSIRSTLAGAGIVNVREANIVVSSWGRSPRDTGIAAYLLAMLRSSDSVQARYSPIERLSVDWDGLYDVLGKRIDLLVRVFPLQDLEHRLSWHGAAARGAAIRAGATDHPANALNALLNTHRLAVVNPPSAIVLESKVAQVVIWNLYEQGAYFDHEERSLVESYLLPTYLDPPPGNEPYVVKPAFGADGDTIAIVNPDVGVVNQSKCTTYSDQTMVYQRYAELPAMEIPTELGPRVLKTITSCFVVSGVPIGVCMRAGGAITDDSAWVLPVCVSS